MTSLITSFDTNHTDQINDAQFDFYGRHLATCSSDGTVKIWEIEENSQKLISELKGHKSAVWQIVWSNPKFGNLLASCSYDRKVIVWKEVNPHNWKVFYEYNEFQQSVNSISFSPQEYGLKLACACSDGTVTILTLDGNNWTHYTFNSHQYGVSSVSWCPYSLFIQDRENPKLVSGGIDNNVNVWYQKSDLTWDLEVSLNGHNDWVNDVAWCPSVTSELKFASCGQDGKVYVWKRRSDGEWEHNDIEVGKKSVCRVNWNGNGDVLAVSSSDGDVSFCREKEDRWETFVLNQE